MNQTAIIPADLVDREQWVVFDAAKVPYSAGTGARASTDRPLNVDRFPDSYPESDQRVYGCRFRFLPG